MQENREEAKKYKERYLEGIENFLKYREAEFKQKRNDYFSGFYKNPEKYRNDLKSMFGYPLDGSRTDGIPNVKQEFFSREDGHDVIRISFEIIDGLWMSGLLFKKDEKKRPLVIFQHGGGGTPELVYNSHDGVGNYNGVIQRILKHEVNVFAPQLLLWNQELYTPAFNRAQIDGALKRVGSSITAVEVFGITRIIDWFQKQEYVKNFGMVGLSYGGFYTLMTAALDTRIKSAISCVYFNDRTAYPWTDWTWQNAAEKFYDAEIACLVYPRRLCIEVATRDEVFAIESAEHELSRLSELAKFTDADWLEIICFDGTHEFCKDDKPIEKLVNDLITA